MEPVSSNAAMRLAAIHGHLSMQPCHQHVIHNYQPIGPADLSRERDNASFQVQDMTEILFGGKENVEALNLGYQLIQRDPELRMRDDHQYDLTPAEDREQTMRQIARMIQYRDQNQDERFCMGLSLALDYYSQSFAMRTYIQDVLFIYFLKLHCTSEQQDRWLKDAISWRLIGSFAMTELGHSSNLRTLETSATFDSATNEFVIHSPTLTSTKWWIGLAGETATHTAAICQTFVDGAFHGTNWFMIPLRDPKTGKLLPGVTCGHLGQKHSRQGLDNGWIQFTQVRVPRENMLMRWASISPDGVFKPSVSPVASYVVLIPERLSLVRNAQVMTSQALTIAIRYGAVRRQGNRDEQILDYQTHYTSLMPGLAFTYMLNVVTAGLSDRWDEISSPSKNNLDELVRELPDFHGITTGFKGTLGWYITELLENCRRACGGHAYSSYNALPGIIGDFATITSGGGDNTVLMQQTARYLLSSIRLAKQRTEVIGDSVIYFNDLSKILSQSTTNCQDLRDLENPQFVVDALTWLSAKKVSDLSAVIAQATKETYDTIWNENQLELIQVAGVHSWRYFLLLYLRGIEQYRKSSAYAMLEKMGRLMGTFILLRQLDLFLEEGYFGPEHTKRIRSLFLEQCKDLRSDAVPLVDAWIIPDFILKAPIGKYDGNIYPAYFGTVTASQKSFDPPAYWMKYVQPVVNRPRPGEKKKCGC